MKILIFTFLTIIMQFKINCIAQYAQYMPPDSSTMPSVGKPIPAFSLPIKGYKIPVITNENLKGKWYILSFWYRGCADAVESIGKVNKLYNEFGDRLPIFLIGRNDVRNFGKGIDSLYYRLIKRQKLNLPYSFDSIITREWAIWAFPKLYIVDPVGVVRFITTGADLTREKIYDLLEGRQVSLSPAEADRPRFFGRNIADSSKQIVYRSSLIKWNGESMFAPAVNEYRAVYAGKSGLPHGYQAARLPLFALFNIAYFGKWIWTRSDSFSYKNIYPRPILETKDSSIFRFDFVDGEGIYNYEMVAPYLLRTEEIMNMMQKELCALFNLEGYIEKRKVPVYTLIAEPWAGSKLKSKRNPEAYSTNIDGDGGAGGFTITNTPIENFLDLVTRYLDSSIPYFDETGIKENIDITMDALMMDRNQVIKALKKNGLNLVLGEKEMQVLVLRDCSNSNCDK